MPKQKVYFIGAGPGKPDLITLRGFNILAEAEVVVYDYLVDKRILEDVKQGAELICCKNKAKEFRSSNRANSEQEIINRILVKKAKQGKKVVRLKSGDPAIFSRLSQEIEALADQNIEFEIVPGVTAASAASAYTGIPITDRRFASSCVFVTAQEDPRKKISRLNWKAIANCGTIVLYMAVNNLEKVVKKLELSGKKKSIPIAIVQNASRPNQKVVTGTLTNIAAKLKQNKVKAPAIIIIGEVVKLETEFNWFKNNKRVLFTGLSKEKFFLKGNYIHLPLIKIIAMDDYKEFDRHLKGIVTFDWILFTSRYAVKYFFQRLLNLGFDTRKLTSVKIAAIGQSTARALLSQGVKADFIPREESSKGLIKSFRKKDLKGKRMFLPRSDISDKGLEAALQKQGVEVIASFAYQNVISDNLPELYLDEFNEFMFTSPSGVRNFKKTYKQLPKAKKARCIGKVTLKEAKRCRLWN